MTRYPNVVWFLIDSIRNYPTDQDLRGKLPVMDRFAQSSVEFKNCVTTAPSTIMSISAMMTGLPAYFLARNYDDFRFDSLFYSSLANVLKRNGYASYAFLRGPETRDKFRHLLDPVPRRFWAPHLRHRFKWTNEDLNLVLERVLHAGIPRPAFLFFHYNPKAASKRGVLADPGVSDRVETAWGMLKEAGFTSANTIYIMCSDHGFPDPSTGLTTEWEIKHRLSHDLVLTDDNILIPLSIQYPGCTPDQIGSLVSSLDIFPTLLDLARISGSTEIKRSIDGTSLVPLMEAGNEATYPRRFFRCDSRLMLQTGRSTVIRSRDFKYIRYHDEYRVPVAGKESPKSEVLIDLRQDPIETTNLLLSESVTTDNLQALEACRAEFTRTEARAVEFQIDYLLARNQDIFLAKSSTDNARPAPKTLLVFEPNTAAYAEIGLGAIARAYPQAYADVLTGHNNLSDRFAGMARKIFVYSEQENGQITAPGLEQKGDSLLYDLVILFVQNPSLPIVSDLLNITKTVKARNNFILDCNFSVYRPRRYWFYRFRALIQQLLYALEEPTILLSQAKVGTQFLVRHVMRRLVLWEHWDEVEPHGGQNDR